MVKKKKQSKGLDFVEFGLNKNNSVYLKNVSYVLGKAAAIAENTGDTETLLHIASAWLEIDSRNKSKRETKTKRKLPMGFTTQTDSDRISDLEEDDE